VPFTTEESKLIGRLIRYTLVGAVLLLAMVGACVLR